MSLINTIGLFLLSTLKEKEYRCLVKVSKNIMSISICSKQILLILKSCEVAYFLLRFHYKYEFSRISITTKEDLL